jgi:PhnB protein
MNSARRDSEQPLAQETTMAAKPIPEGYERATPYLCVSGASDAIAFYVKAFGAVETSRLAEPDGRLGHAEIRIGDAPLMLSDEYPEEGVRSPATLGGTPVAIHLYVTDVDALAERAVAAGAKLLRPVADQFYGDRSATLLDPFGHRWFFATRKEDVSVADMQRRYDAMRAHAQK